MNDINEIYHLFKTNTSRRLAQLKALVLVKIFLNSGTQNVVIKGDGVGAISEKVFLNKMHVFINDKANRSLRMIRSHRQDESAIVSLII